MWRISTLTVVVFLPSMWGISPGYTAEYSAQQLILGAAARTVAVFSGDIEFRRVSGNRGYPKTEWTTHRRETRSGASYRIRYPSGHPSTTINDGQKHMIYLATPQPDGSESRALSVRRPVQGDEGYGEGNSRLLLTSPFGVGGIWVRDTREYLEKHAHRARLAGTESVDGVATHVVEVDVPEEEIGAAFVSLFRTMRRTGGGIIRMNVAPQLGFVVPKCEYLDRERNVCDRFTASEFAELAPGLWLPRRVSAERLSEEHGFYCKVEIISANSLNEPIDPGEFAFTIPEGTKIWDTRSGVPVAVTVGQDTPLRDHRDYEKLLEQAGIVPQPSRRPWITWVLWIGSAVLLAGHGLWWWLQRRSQAATGLVHGHE